MGVVSELGNSGYSVIPADIGPALRGTIAEWDWMQSMQRVSTGQPSLAPTVTRQPTAAPERNFARLRKGSGRLAPAHRQVPAQSALGGLAQHPLIFP